MIAKLLCALGLAVALGWPGAGTATGTEPPLAIRRVDALRSNSRVWVRIEGTFPSGDLVQLEYPLQILVREIGGLDRFIWFAPPAEARMGSTTFEGAVSADALLTLETHAAPDPVSRILHLGSEHLELQLGPYFAGGEAEAVLFVIYRGAPVFSNPLPFHVEEVE